MMLYLFICRPDLAEVTTTTIRRGTLFSIKVNTKVPTSSLSLQTEFTCTLEIPGTSFSLMEKTLFFPEPQVAPKASMVSGAGIRGRWGLGMAMISSVTVMFVVWG